MNWNHSSEFTAVVAAVWLLLAAVAVPAAAVSVDGNAVSVPEEGRVGTQVTGTVTLTNLYREPAREQWELTGRTELRSVTWVVEYVDQTGAKTGQDEFTGQQLSGVTLRADDGVSEVRVQVTGTVPPVEEFSYDPPQRFLLLSLTQGQAGGASAGIDAWHTHHYTNESDRVRGVLDEANDSIAAAEAAGGSTATASESFESAVDAYENRNFDNAERLAERASGEAESAQGSAETRRLLLYGGGAAVVVVAVVGGVLYWRSNREEYDKLG